MLVEHGVLPHIIADLSLREKLIMKAAIERHAKELKELRK